MASSLSANTIINRATDVSSLNLPVFQAIKRDANALREAAVVVGVVAIASGIGGAADGVGGIILGIIGAFAGWAIFGALTYFLGSEVMGTPVTSASVVAIMSALGYARAPMILEFFGFLGAVGELVGGLGAIWALVVAIVAIRETLAISTGRAIIVGFAALIASGIVTTVLGVIFGIGFTV